MSKPDRRRVLWLSAMVLMACTACASAAHESLCIQTLDGETHAFQVELAATPEVRQRGLMHRTSLADNAGMLFDFEREQPISMWMKNTPLSLDMLFIKASGRILRIERNTRPESLRSIDAGGPVRGVLEVPAGTTRRLNIRAGDQVLHPVFGTNCGA